jgi:adenylate cyclase
MAATLKLEETGEIFSLQDFNLIGRSQDATIRLLDNGVSRQHATIRRDGKQFWLTDLGSANGTFVNEVAISTARVLRHNDHVQFGTTVFLFDHEESDATRELTAGTRTQVIQTVALPVKSVKATLLVGDLKDFTAISAQLTAEEVAAMLREWYADCEAILKPRGAVIDKFIGDGVFAYWPSADDDARAKATESAKLLCGPPVTPSPTRRWLLQNLGIHVNCHVGLNVGPVALGAMGRGVNTAVGEAVNVTFRIEALTRKLVQPVLASAAFVQGSRAVESQYRSLGPHSLKGQPDPVEVFALVDQPARASLSITDS